MNSSNKSSSLEADNKVKNILHDIFSELHHLLSIASTDDLMAASKYHGASKHMRRALEALAQESLSTSHREPARIGETNNVKQGSLNSNDQNPRRERVWNLDAILKAIVASPRFSSKAGIKDFARTNNLRLEIRARDSRVDAARKLSRSILEIPIDRRSEILTLIAEKPDTQTQGWVDVIKGSR